MGIFIKMKRAFFKGHVDLTEKQNKILNIVFFTTVIGTFLSMIGIVIYYAYSFAALSNGTPNQWLLNIFSDFTYITEVSLTENPYDPHLDSGSSYPPLAIAILFPFGLICKSVYALYSHDPGTDIYQFTSQVMLHPQFWISLLLFFILCSVAVILAVIKMYKLTPMASLKVAIIILLSSPFVYAIMRGNTIYFAIIFILLFLLLHEHKNPFVRELGYLCLVIAGLIKIYPLFFGVYLLHKKKIFASIRVAIYTVVLFFLSFFIYGGISDISKFVNNLGGFADTTKRLLETNNLSITALLNKIASLFVNVRDNKILGYINIAVLALTFVVATVAAVYTKNSFSRAAIASSIVILIPSVSYFYILVFATLPFMEFIRNYEEMGKKRRILYVITFVFLFLTPTILAQNLFCILSSL